MSRKKLANCSPLFPHPFDVFPRSPFAGRPFLQSETLWGLLQLPMLYLVVGGSQKALLALLGLRNPWNNRASQGKELQLSGFHTFSSRPPGRYVEGPGMALAVWFAQD